MIVESLKLKMENMPRVKAEMGEYVVIETMRNGVTIHEAICYVEAIEYNVSSGVTSKVRLNVFNPHSPGITNSYDLIPEINNSDIDKDCSKLK